MNGLLHEPPSCSSATMPSTEMLLFQLEEWPILRSEPVNKRRFISASSHPYPTDPMSDLSLTHTAPLFG